MIKLYLQDKDQMLQSINNSHDNHLNILNTKLDQLTNNENLSSQKLFESIQISEYERNRYRMMEIENLSKRSV